MSSERLLEQKVKVEQQCQQIIAAAKIVKETQSSRKEQHASEIIISAHLTSAQEALAKASRAVQETPPSTDTKPSRNGIESKLTMFERSKTLLAWQASRGTKASIRRFAK